MIKIDGEKIILDGTPKVLMCEMTFLLGMLRSRLMSQGYAAESIKHDIDTAVKTSEYHRLDKLRSDAKMTAMEERLKIN